MSEPTLKELLRKRSGPCARDHCRKLRGQAADEIERLEDELAVMGRNEWTAVDRHLKDAEQIERLRTALVEIRDHPEEDGVADSMEAIAREALDSGGE